MKLASKEKSAVGSALRENCASPYHMLLAPQWATEAKRLASEFQRTHQERHLQALARHLDGVFERLTKGGKP
jgi:hypothetical protein